MTRPISCMLLAALIWAASVAVAQTCEPQFIGGDGGTPQGIAVKGDTVYLDRGAGGVQIIDVSDLANPRPVGWLPITWPARSIAISNDRLYVHGSGRYLHVFDIGTPHQPVWLGAAEDGRFEGGMVVSGGVAFFAGHRQGLLTIMDMRDPTSPVERGFFPHHTCPTCIHPTGHKIAHVATGISVVTTSLSDRTFTYHDARIFDHSDPSAIERIGTFGLPWFAQRISVHDSIAYVASQGLHTFDLGDPTRPTALDTLDELYVNDFDWRPVWTLALTNRSSLAVIDTTNPDDLRIVNEVALPSQGNVLKVDAGRAFVAGAQGLYVLDVRDRVNPRLVGQLPLLTARITRLAKIDDLIIAAGGGTTVVSVADPMRPEVVPVLDVFLGGSDVISIGNLVLSTGSGVLREVRIMDLSDPTASWLMRGRIYTLGSPSRVATDGRLAYISTAPYGPHPGGVGIYNIDDPDEPRLVKQLDVTAPNDILVEDGLLFALNAFEREVIIFDVRDPAAAAEVGRVYLGETMAAMAYLDGTLYLTHFVDPTRTRLHAYDVRDPRRPRYLSSTPLPGGTTHELVAHELAGRGGLLFLAHGSVGVLVLDAAIPASPRLIGSFDTSYSAHGLLVEGSTVYVGEHDGGLKILDVSTCGSCPADLDGDGELTVLDFLAFQNAFDAGEALADIDRDGRLTIFDFLAFQTAFDDGC